MCACVRVCFQRRTTRQLQPLQQSLQFTKNKIPNSKHNTLAGTRRAEGKWSVFVQPFPGRSPDEVPLTVSWHPVSSLGLRESPASTQRTSARSQSRESGPSKKEHYANAMCVNAASSGLPGAAWVFFVPLQLSAVNPGSCRFPPPGEDQLWL